MRELPLDVSICRHAILQPGIFVAPDLSLDPRFKSNPLVDVENGLHYYAGAPLETPSGLPLGTLCVLDRKPRPGDISDNHARTLSVLARHVMSELELRRTIAERQKDLERSREREARLRLSEERYRTIFEQAHDFILTATLDQVFTSVNPSMAAALGYTEAELIGRSFAKFLEPDQFEHTTEMVQKKLREGGTTRHEVRVPTRDGRKLRWEVTSQLTLGPDGEPTSIHAICRDITEQRRAEEHPLHGE